MQERKGGRWRRLGGLFGAVGCAAALLAAPGIAQAKPGALDQSFGNAGKVATRLSLRHQEVGKVHAALGPDESLVLGAGHEVLRYLSDGHLDPSFGEGGSLSIAPRGGLTFEISDLAVDGQGRVTVFATGVGAPYKSFGMYPLGSIAPGFVAVFRFEADGRPDAGFGDGGVTISDFGLDFSSPYEAPASYAGQGALDSQGRATLIVGQQQILANCGHSHFEDVDRAVARLNADGKPDSSFGGGDGVVELPALPRIVGLSVTSGDGLLLDGSRGFELNHCRSPNGPTLLRLEADGSTDPTFGSEGVREYLGGGEPDAMATVGGGEIALLGGPVGGQVLRLAPSGDPVATFGKGGVARVPIPGEAASAGQSVVVGSGGSVYVIGTRVVERGIGRSHGPRGRWIYVARLLASGRLDRSFGNKGSISIQFGHDSRANGETGLLDGSGRLVVAGALSRPGAKPLAGLGLIRYSAG